jgi:hypothetical protein
MGKVTRSAINTFLILFFVSAILIGFWLGIIYSVFMFGANAKSLILLGSFCATFVASVIAEEQNERIKSGIFGLMGGTGAGAIASLITSDNELLLIGVAGSAVGAVLGWFTSLILCAWVHKSETGKAVLTYLSTGFSGLRAEITLNERIKNQNLQIDAIRTWNSYKSRTIQKQLTDILEIEKSIDRNAVVKIVVNEWLASVVNMFEFLFRLGGNSFQGYRPRATVIRFKQIEGNQVGNHWVFNTGGQRSFNTIKTFGENSVGYKVLTGELPSPHFDNFESANKTGENRGAINEEKSFMTFYVSDDTILAVDWPSVLALEDSIVKTISNLFEDDICPSINKLIKNWHEIPQNSINS